MNDSVFLDTNVLVYSYSNSEIDKQKIARKLIAESNSYISTQVLQEVCNIVTNCTTLYSEDMHDGQTISGSLVIRNPFSLR